MKPIEDRGHALQVMKPLALKRYEPNRVPDPGQCVDCLIIVNDRKDGTPRGRLSISNGASWDHVAWLDDVPSATASQAVPSIDLVPLVRSAVAEMLPALPAREVKTIAAMPASDADTAAIAQALLEMSETINRLNHANHDLQNRVAFLENNALARAQLIREAS